MTTFNYSKIEKIFDLKITKTGFLKSEQSKKIPTAKKTETGVRSWSLEDLPFIGEQYGFIQKSKLKDPKVVTVFSSKGGCFKSSICFTMARMYALHNLKVLVIGLDYQMDISNMLSGGYLNKDDDELSLEEIDKSPQVKGLYDLAMGNATLEEIIQPTEIQTLHFIPETANLNILSEFLTSKNKREYWLNTNVIQKIKSDYDLILLDLGPSWSLLTSNALVATDVLVSPVETKILHYQNIKNFVTYLDNFQKQMELNFKTVYIPTKFSPTKKLSSSIRKYYLTNLPTTNTSIRESNQIEEANAQYLSVIETSPASLIASETRELLKEIFDNYVADNTKSVENKSWH